MKILIVYGTVEGHTAKIARFVAKSVTEAGHEAVLVNSEETSGEVSFDGLDGVILAAPVHERRHPRAFEAFLNGKREALAALPTLFLSVSLRVAFDDGREEAQDFADEMKMRTGLEPTRELLVAGAIRTESYDYYASQVMRHVVLRGQKFDPAIRDHEFTDWEALATGVNDFLRAL